MKKLILLACLVGLSAPVQARPAQSDRAVRHENRLATRKVDERMGRTIAAVTAAESRHVVSRRRAVALRNLVDRMRTDYARNQRAQGFVSAGELASYNRSLDRIDREIRHR